MADDVAQRLFAFKTLKVNTADQRAAIHQNGRVWPEETHPANGTSIKSIQPHRDVDVHSGGSPLDFRPIALVRDRMSFAATQSLTHAPL
jgi:hypothetical protein